MTLLPRTRRFASQALSLNAVEWGDREAPPLILLHGGRDHARSWDAIARGFAADRFVICPDLRGHGDSDWTRDGSYEIQDFVYDFAALIDAYGIERAEMLGHSYGGNISLRYTGLFPDRVRRLVNIEGLGDAPETAARLAARDMGDRMRSWIEATRAGQQRSLKPYPSLEAAVARMQDANPHLADDLAHHLTLHGTRTLADGAIQFKYDPRFWVFSPFDITTEQKIALWRAVTCPVLLIYGRDSWASNPAEDGRTAHFKDVRTEVLEDAGHWVHHDRADAVLTLLRGFFDTQATP